MRINVYTNGIKHKCKTKRFKSLKSCSDFISLGIIDGSPIRLKLLDGGYLTVPNDLAKNSTFEIKH